MTRMTPLIVYAAFVLLMYTLTSCDKECLCHFNDDGSSRAKFEVDVDWSNFDKEKVSGMTVMCFSEDGTSPLKLLSNDIRKAQFLLSENFYDFLVINQSENEYSSLAFSGMDSYQTAKVNAVDYSGSHWLGSDARVIAEPEWLAVGRMEDAVVSCDMIAESTGIPCGCNNCCCEVLHTGKSFNLGTIFPKNVIYSFYIKVNITGISNLKSVRASISGLVDSHDLSSGINGQTSAVQLLQSWRTHKDSSTDGYIESSARTFGLPSVDPSLVFDLQLMLLDGKTIVKNTIDVTDLVTIDEADKVISLELTLTEPLPDTRPSSGGGFEASVNEWEETDNVDIIL